MDVLMLRFDPAGFERFAFELAEWANRAAPLAVAVIVLALGFVWLMGRPRRDS